MKQIDYQIDRRPIEKATGWKNMSTSGTTRPETEAFEMPVLKTELLKRFHSSTTSNGTVLFQSKTL
ncbi:MAG: hypothetical protein Q8M57_02230 [Nitrosomonas sp.]|uniref:hypothetical protein n=1 Tax=Nitrosomonas sp. TaxID=42353 RepID=UPI0027324881|nr:hypothetical protein [Nitrosomonas sp.]MDP3279862.1 hypothetical protein [Nitrosomonas sp.]